ncbi:PAS domain S-box protein [Prosthecochloris sp. N3]|uniref:histidine kinase n=1 Tax=Prosthecochloris ethylica TaxID=2743976 RepID=A0ABR9XRA2_9CHLB|nr:PAS domain S-box protein [Prosthecochloris ethylica]MBF0586044.1 PAS domain S-box protein [Prosthecochloris ethylica]MBF0636556.1 PAS domain S-box protein [Prosthecochloris ethylica]MEC9487826.1 PAS domain S-box protein [Prosthecochloris sp.]NUK47188.1 PAS domain S-box protein [Prosthecochloris ethylica]
MNAPRYTILDSLSFSVAVLDNRGVIVFVNRAWKEFGKSNGARSDYLGKPYLDYCACDDEGKHSDTVLKGIQNVLNRSIPSFSHEYPCHSPVEQRWFRMIVTPHGTGSGQGAVITHENITDRKLAEHHALFSTEQLSLIVNNVDAGIIGIDISRLDAYFEQLRARNVRTIHEHLQRNPRFLKETSSLIKITSINNSALTMYKAGNSSALLSKGNGFFFFRSSTRTYIRALQAIYEQRSSFEFTSVQYDLDGSPFQVLAKIAIPRSAEHRHRLIICLVDITELKKRENELENIRNYLHSILEGMFDPMLVIDKHFVITDLNKKFLDQVGGERSDYIGKECHQAGLVIGHHCKSKELCPVRRMHYSRKPFVCEQRAVDEHGSIRHYQVSSFPLLDSRGMLEKCVEIYHDITHIKTSQQVLRKQLDFTEKLLDTVSVAIYYQKSDGRFIGCNRAFELFTGVERRKLRGLTPEKVFHPGTARHFTLPGEQAIPDDGHHDATVQIETSHGPRDVAFRRAAYRHSDGRVAGYITVITDRTEQLQYENKIRKSEEQFRHLAEKSPNIIVIRSDEEILYVNPACSDLLGYSRDELVGTSLRYSDLCFRPLSQQASGNDTREILLKTNNGEKLTCISSSAPIEFDGTMATMEISTDITKLKELEEKYIQSQRLNSLGTLAGGIAHDFNNIIASILGYATMTLDDIDHDSVAGRNVAVIIDACRRAADLVDQILSFSRKSKGGKQVINLRDILMESLAFVKPLTPSSIDLRYDIAPVICMIHADPVKVQQSIINLCTNAIQAIERTGTISISLKNIEIPAGSDFSTANPDQPARTVAELSIADTGKGIEEGDLERIFEPFFTTKEVGQGTGLGLAEVYGVVSDLGGTISVDSMPDAGTVFILRIPEHKTEGTP